MTIIEETAGEDSVLVDCPEADMIPAVVATASPKSTSSISPSAELRISSPSSGLGSSLRKVKFTFDDSDRATSLADEKKRSLDSPRSRSSTEMKVDGFSATVKITPGSPKASSPRAASKTLIARVSSKKGVLKNSSPMCESDKKKLSFRLKKEERAMEMVKLGQELTKWTHSGKQLRRFLKVSEDGLFIEASTKSIFKSSTYGVRRIEIARIKNVVYGPRTMAFSAKLNWETDASWRCFSIVTDERTWDFMADSDDSALLWFFAIQSMCILKKPFVSWAKLLWIKAILKSAQKALVKKVCLEDYWNELALQVKTAGIPGHA